MYNPKWDCYRFEPEVVILLINHYGLSQLLSTKNSGLSTS